MTYLSCVLLFLPGTPALDDGCASRGTSSWTCVPSSTRMPHTHTRVWHCGVTCHALSTAASTSTCSLLSPLSSRKCLTCWRLALLCTKPRQDQTTVVSSSIRFRFFMTHELAECARFSISVSEKCCLPLCSYQWRDAGALGSPLWWWQRVYELWSAMKACVEASALFSLRHSQGRTL